MYHKAGGIEICVAIFFGYDRKISANILECIILCVCVCVCVYIYIYIYIITNGTIYYLRYFKVTMQLLAVAAIQSAQLSGV